MRPWPGYCAALKALPGRQREVSIQLLDALGILGMPMAVDVAIYTGLRTVLLALR